MSNQINLKKWMSKINGYKFVNSINIPGTRSSGAMISSIVNYTNQSIRNVAAQLNSIDYQLDTGVRCFELKGVVYLNDLYESFAGNRQSQKIRDIFRIFFDFLDNNPTEFLIVIISPDNETSWGSNTIFSNVIKDIFDNNRNRFCLNPNPIVCKVRKKIIPIKMGWTANWYNGLYFDFDRTVNQESLLISNTINNKIYNFNIQYYWNFYYFGPGNQVPAKIPYVNSLLQAAETWKNTKNKNSIPSYFLNYLTGISYNLDKLQFAQGMDIPIKAELAKGKKFRGIMMFDYITPEITELYIKSNDLLS